MAANVEEKELESYDFIVVGGGIAGVSCTEYLSSLNIDRTICLISSTDLVKTVCNIRKFARTLEEFEVKEKPLNSLASDCHNVTVVKTTVIGFDHKAHKVLASNNKEYWYKKLCICTGARPNLIVKENEHVLGLRDLQSVEDFQNRLSTARRVVIVGNGGISLELVYELTGCEVIWVIKDDAIGNAYFDKGAAQFFLSSLKQGCSLQEEMSNKNKESCAQNSQDDKMIAEGKSNYGAALGFGWKEELSFRKYSTDEKMQKNVTVEYNSEVRNLFTRERFKILHGDMFREPGWNIYLELQSGKIIGCDFVVSATGVMPNVEAFVASAELNVAEDGGLMVDKHMRTNINNVYAAGDVCNASWEHSDYWMQMRLWTQANQMGAYAAKCMTSDMDGSENFMDFCFEMFAHVTSFFGYKVILLGKYNGQGLGSDYEVLLRCTMGQEYVKVVLHHGKIHGALLIGETDLEETLENLILNQMDVSMFGENLLDPNIDIEDYFD
ncbi:pyridine nucleotide-disulfide oxidoreductase domain-containing protein 1-like [Dendronephthya gigantea]|uniref:pyridine nucleotide-disulfide oxidoreductase domain-containing protein 1-like n=1 Tax=Dendronephthya gigantea TaxID=151771 RepID=UPI00106CD7A7|nr:pyridine nucleotide-disulfide oxidoreductase domain-containing protein 1-like [Dendronephthya gigantea]